MRVTTFVIGQRLTGADRVGVARAVKAVRRLAREALVKAAVEHRWDGPGVGMVVVAERKEQHAHDSSGVDVGAYNALVDGAVAHYVVNGWSVVVMGRRSARVLKAVGARHPKHLP